MSRSDDPDVYPPGAVLQLIDSARTTEITARVLRARMTGPAGSVGCDVLDARELACLSAVAKRLVPQDDRTAAIDLTAWFHHRLARGPGAGWRYAVLPPAAELHKLGLAAMDACAFAQFGDRFAALPPKFQDELLQSVQSGATAVGEWHRIDQRLWFEETLALLVELYFSHPLALDTMGYAGMADAGGWPDAGLEAREAFEPAPLQEARSKP